MPVQGDLFGCRKNPLPTAMASLAKFARKVVGYRGAESVIAVCPTVTEKTLPSSVGITTRSRPTALPISFAPRGRDGVTHDTLTDRVQNTATKTSPFFTKPAPSTAFSARTGITDTDLKGSER